MRQLTNNEKRMITGGHNCACQSSDEKGVHVSVSMEYDGPSCILQCCSHYHHEKWTWFSEYYLATGSCK